MRTCCRAVARRGLRSGTRAGSRQSTRARECARAPRTPFHDWSRPTAHVSIASAARGWLAAGDAATAFDPLSSQGLMHALSSGMVGGEALARHLDGDDAAMSEYQNGTDRAFHEYLRLHGLITARSNDGGGRSFGGAGTPPAHERLSPRVAGSCHLGGGEDDQGRYSRAPRVPERQRGRDCGGSLLETGRQCGDLQDYPSVHGMLIVGQETVFLSHLPIFGSPHDYQVILRRPSPSPTAIREADYFADRKRTGTKVYTLEPDRFVLPGLASASPLSSFTANIYRGHFERFPSQRAKDAARIAQSVNVTVSRVVHFRKFDPAATRPPQLEYLVFGKGTSCSSRIS